MYVCTRVCACVYIIKGFVAREIDTTGPGAVNDDDIGK